MINYKNEIWAFIPARSGSKGIKNKNIKKLKGVPLIGHSILLANKIKLVKKIVFSSDSIKYIHIAKKFKCDEYELRSKKVSTSSASEHSVFFEFISRRIIQNKKVPKYFLHLRPTTPLRNKNTVNRAINKFLKNKNNITSLRTFSEMPNPAYRSNRIVNGKICSIIKKDFNMDKYYKPRHFFPKTYFGNGVADIYKTENILKGFLFGNRVCPLVTKDIFNDIDDLNDFKYTEFFMK